jgi:CDP-diglyceride synthetase
LDKKRPPLSSNLTWNGVLLGGCGVTILLVVVGWLVSASVELPQLGIALLVGLGTVTGAVLSLYFMSPASPKPKKKKTKKTHVRKPLPPP